MLIRRAYYGEKKQTLNSLQNPHIYIYTKAKTLSREFHIGISEIFKKFGNLKFFSYLYIENVYTNMLKLIEKGTWNDKHYRAFVSDQKNIIKNIKLIEEEVYNIANTKNFTIKIEKMVEFDEYHITIIYKG